MTRQYLTALFLTATMVILVYIGLAMVIKTTETSAAIVNISGRQRMLSQRIAMVSRDFVSKQRKIDRERYRAVLLSVADLMEKSHDWLINGNPEMHLPGNPSPALYAIYFEEPFMIDKRVRQFVAGAKALANESAENISPHGESMKFLRNNKDILLLRDLDALVSQYQKESEEEVAWLNQLAIGALSTILFLLFLEGMLIFRPLTQRIQQEADSLEQYSARIKKALHNAEDVLNILARPPRLMPYFTTSPIYRYCKEVGGGDTIRGISYPARYSGLLVHDVSGHDIEEMLLNILATALADNAKYSIKEKGVNLPSSFLTTLNRELLDYCEPTGHYVTAAYYLLDFEHRTINLSLAGHPRPWLFSPAAPPAQIGEYGLLMGMFEVTQDGEDRYLDIAHQLKEEETLLLYTDGLMEQENEAGQQFQNIFVNSIAPTLGGKNPHEAFAIIQENFELHCNGKTPEDDVSFMVVGVRPEDSYETRSYAPSTRLTDSLITLSAELGRITNPYKGDKLCDCESSEQCCIIEEVPEAYASIIAKVTNEAWPKKQIDRIELVMLELISNAIIHGGNFSDKHCFEIRSSLHNDILEVCISDKGAGVGWNVLAQSVTEEDIARGQGRGFRIISNFSSEVYFGESGSDIWVIFDKEQ